MDLDLSRDDVTLLERVLTSYLSDLRAEIVGTDRYALRKELRLEEQRIRQLFEQVHELVA